jgi:hypothetical protein
MALVREDPQNAGPQQQHKCQPAVICNTPCLHNNQVSMCKHTYFNATYKEHIFYSRTLQSEVNGKMKYLYYSQV